MKSLEGKISLVTGASRGIGRSIAVSLAKEGAFVYVNYSSSPEAAEETVSLCKQAGGEAESVKFNVSNSEEVSEIIAQILKEKGQIDILVNNAGITRDGLFIRTKDEDWHSVLDINLSGAFYVSRSVARSMMKKKSGKIINISSVVGEMGNAGQVNYVSSKAGLIGFTKSLARELASRNVNVNAVTPGFIESDMTKDLDPEIKAKHFDVIPLARYGKPEEIANLVKFLASSDSDYITGQIIGVNGGMYM